MPTGTVAFFDGTTLLGTSPVSGGAASLALFSSHLGVRPLTAVYRGDGKLFGSISAARMLHVVSTAKPAITSITDVKNDHGKQVRLRFRASPYDYPGSGTAITEYDVFRKINPSFAASMARRSARLFSPDGAYSPHVLVDGWDFVGSLSARTDSAYNLVVPTLADSNFWGFHRATFFVSAITATPNVYFDSAPDSGYSVDNLVATTDAPDGAPPAFALEGIRPNPSFGGRLSVTLTLPVSAPARLELLDVSGRQVAAREVGELGAGRHAVDLIGGRRLKPGLYLVRLTQGTNARVTRVAVVD
jgi:hypothetical protein